MNETLPWKFSAYATVYEWRGCEKTRNVAMLLSAEKCELNILSKRAKFCFLVWTDLVSLSNAAYYLILKKIYWETHSIKHSF